MAKVITPAATVDDGWAAPATPAPVAGVNSRDALPPKPPMVGPKKHDPKRHLWANPAVVAAKAKTNELKLQRDALDRQIDEIITQRNLDRLGVHRRAVAQSLVDGTPRPMANAIDDDMAAVQKERAVLDEAVGIAEERERHAERVANDAIIRSLWPELTSIVEEYLKAAEALAAVAEREDAFFKEVMNGGTGMLMMQSVDFGQIDDVRWRLERMRQQYDDMLKNRQSHLNSNPPK